MTDCCLCSAIGESRHGRIPEGWHFSICDEHYARSIEQSQKPPAPRVIVLGSPSNEDAYIAAVLCGRVKSLASLAELVPPTSTMLQ
jgi:predicted dehydrogenase